MSSKRKPHRSPYSRSRSLGGFVTLVGRALQYSDGPSGHSVAVDLKRLLLVPTPWTIDDVVTPGYEQLIAEGKIINNPLRTVKTTYVDGVSGFTGTYTSGSTTYTWIEEKYGPVRFGPPRVLPHGINVANLRTYVETQCLASATTSSLQGLVAIAEGKKTLQMLVSPLSSISSLLTYLVKLRQGRKNIAILSRGRTLIINGRTFRNPNFYYRGPGKLVKVPSGTVVVPAGTAISGAILANNLGLRPLMMDLEAFLKDIPQAHQEDRKSFRKKLSDTWKNVTYDTYVSSGCSFPVKITTDVEVLVRSVVMVKDKIDILQDFGMSVFDIPSAAWELIPYSFILDYFINLGDVLGAQRALSTQDILACSTTTRTTTTVTREWLAGTLALPYKMVSNVHGTDVWSSVEKDRRTYFEQGLAYRPISTVFRPTVVQNLLSLIVQNLAKLNPGKRSRSPFY